MLINALLIITFCGLFLLGVFLNWSA